LLFDVQRREQEGWTVLAVVGELDLAVAPRVRQAGLQAVRPMTVPLTDPPRIVVDLSSTDFMDSAGLGVVLGVIRRARQAGGEAVVVLDPDSMPARTFAVLGLDRVVATGAAVDDVVAGGHAPVLAAEAGGHDG
jgi:anti-sigma B factor antagonist